MATLSDSFFKKYIPDLKVSRETILNYEMYYDLLIQWNNAIPLVQEKTLNEFMIRHIIDSLQIAPALSPDEGSIVDIGTGAGFPGLALAVYGFSNITLIESNRKKTIFLNEVARKTRTKVMIMNQRAELVNEKYDYILSRACSSLSNLLLLMSNVSRETSTGIFHKGASFLTELKEAELNWSFDYELRDSVTDKNSKIIIVKNVSKRYG